MASKERLYELWMLYFAKFSRICSFDFNRFLDSISGHLPCPGNLEVPWTTTPMGHSLRRATVSGRPAKANTMPQTVDK
ncbi:hypothetical protein E2320_001436 [Naja naja]|nr:hypothetical protein E2320_001436 [Naja naja]